MKTLVEFIINKEQYENDINKMLNAFKDEFEATPSIDRPLMIHSDISQYIDYDNGMKIIYYIVDLCDRHSIQYPDWVIKRGPALIGLVNIAGGLAKGV